MKASNASHTELIRSLMQPDVYDHPVTAIQLIETHISWVILTGTYAYKIKKPCDLGFLDFSTLEKRRFFCYEELRLNKRLAEPIYLDVVRITGDVAHPILQGAGEIIEYAVKMIQFPQQAQLDNMLADGKLGNQHIDAFADLVAKFHQHAAVSSPDTSFGNPEQVYQPVAQTCQKIQALQSGTSQYDAQIAELENWSRSIFESLIPLFEQRKCDGFIRECHGDMHLRNLIWLNNEPLAFDCLEFDPDLRWIDTLSDIAFLVMDLHDRNRPQLAQRFLNAYLEHCGDYSGMRVFRFYLVYRAIVRAMVAAIRSRQSDIVRTEKLEAENELLSYLKLALSYIHHAIPMLIITHGMSASGKSTVSQVLLELIGAIRIRSDVERKRMFGIDLSTGNGIGIDKGIYSPEANIKTYSKLKTLAEDILDAGFPVIVDAAFLKYEERQFFQSLAFAKQVPFIILTFSASAETLRHRIQVRERDVSDADLSVLEHQLVNAEPLRDNELSDCILIDTEKPFDAEKTVSEIMRKSQQSILHHP